MNFHGSGDFSVEIFFKALINADATKMKTTQLSKLEIDTLKYLNIAEESLSILCNNYIVKASGARPFQGHNLTQVSKGPKESLRKSLKFFKRPESKSTYCILPASFVFHDHYEAKPDKEDTFPVFDNHLYNSQFSTMASSTRATTRTNKHKTKKRAHIDTSANEVHELPPHHQDPPDLCRRGPNAVQEPNQYDSVPAGRHHLPKIVLDYKINGVTVDVAYFPSLNVHGVDNSGPPFNISLLSIPFGAHDENTKTAHDIITLVIPTLSQEMLNHCLENEARLSVCRTWLIVELEGCPEHLTSLLDQALKQMYLCTRLGVREYTNRKDSFKSLKVQVEEEERGRIWTLAVKLPGGLVANPGVLQGALGGDVLRVTAEPVFAEVKLWMSFLQRHRKQSVIGVQFTVSVGKPHPGKIRKDTSKKDTETRRKGMMRRLGLGEGDSSDDDGSVNKSEETSDDGSYPKPEDRQVSRLRNSLSQMSVGGGGRGRGGRASSRLGLDMKMINGEVTPLVVVIWQAFIVLVSSSCLHIVILFFSTITGAASYVLDKVSPRSRSKKTKASKTKKNDKEELQQAMERLEEIDERERQVKERLEEIEEEERQRQAKKRLEELKEEERLTRARIEKEERQAKKRLEEIEEEARKTKERILRIKEEEEEQALMASISKTMNAMVDDNYDVVKNKGGGDCLPRAGSHQMYGTEEHFMRVRSGIAGKMRRFPSYFSEFMEDNETLEEHITRYTLARGGWIGEPELPAIAMLARVPVCVYDVSGRHEEPLWYPCNPDDDHAWVWSEVDRNAPPMVFRLQGRHYEALVPRPEDSESSEDGSDRELSVLSGSASNEEDDEVDEVDEEDEVVEEEKDEGEGEYQSYISVCIF